MAAALLNSGRAARVRCGSLIFQTITYGRIRRMFYGTKLLPSVRQHHGDAIGRKTQVRDDGTALKQIGEADR